MNRPLIEYLPSFMQKSSIYKSLFNASELEIQELETAIEDLRKQLDINTATWALDIYEKDLGIPTNISKPLSDRRSVIKSKERGTGKVDAGMLKTVVDSYTNGDADIAFDGSIHVSFTSIVGVPPNMDDLELVIEELKPAHIALLYYYLFRMHSSLTTYTHGDLTTFTHSTLREGDLA